MRHAPSGRMPPVRHYSQLIVWKLAEEIRIKVFRLTAKPPFASDFKARSQAEDAANSVGRNIAEGFGCETHTEFARFLEIARRSLNELHDILHGAQLKEYVAQSELAPIRSLSKRIYPAVSRLMAYLRSTPTPRKRLNGASTARTPKGGR
jgi:four helix bundle protein